MTPSILSPQANPIRHKPSPIRVSPRKPTNSNATTRLLPTPLSTSPSRSTSSSYNRFPPSFDHSQSLHHTSSRYPAQQHTPYSPYRPGEYGRSERGLASDRTKIERRLFQGNDDDDLLVPRGQDESGSSPLAPAFEAKMVLRNGASVDLISW